jgi:hypothetical protein
MEKSMEEASAEQASRLFRRVEYLAVIGNLGPMLGLLGTVYGILLAFKKVAESRGAAVAADLADGIYLALVTTVEGLVVGIPALAMFAYFRNRIEAIGEEVNSDAEEIFSVFRRRRESRFRESSRREGGLGESERRRSSESGSSKSRGGSTRSRESRERSRRSSHSTATPNLGPPPEFRELSREQMERRDRPGDRPNESETPRRTPGEEHGL